MLYGGIKRETREGEGKEGKGSGGEGRGVEERGGEREGGKGRDDRLEGLIEGTMVSRRKWKDNTSNN